MAKGKTTVFFCQNCGHESTKWLGQCPGCKEWNTFVEEVVDKKSIGKAGKEQGSEPQLLPLSQIEMTQDKRISTEMKELDRVLGGGIVQGSLVLVGGDPGIGKSTPAAPGMQKPLAKGDQGVVYLRRGIPAADKNTCREDWHIYRQSQIIV